MSSKRLKYIITIFIIIPLLVTVYLIFFAKNTKVDWIDFIRFQNMNYENTNILINPEFIGKELGVVEEKAPSKINRLTFQTKNGCAGYLETGTKFFEIVGYDNRGYIGVCVGNTYYLYKASVVEIPDNLMDTVYFNVIW